MLTLRSLGGKHRIGIDQTRAATDRISSKLAQAKTGSQRRYVSSIAYSHSARSPHYSTNTLNSFNYQLQNQKRRRKNKRNDPEIRFPIALWPIKTDFVYKCTNKQCCSNFDPVRSSKTVSCADPHPKSSHHNS